MATKAIRIIWRLLELASKSGVIMLSLSPHISRKLQPFDLTFLKPLKTYYNQHIEQWLSTHPGRGVTSFQVSHLFGLAYGKAATVNVAVNGFRKAGIFPLNPLDFDNVEFCPADVTDRPDPGMNVSLPSTSQQPSGTALGASSSEDISSQDKENMPEEFTSSTSAGFSENFCVEIHLWI